MYNLEDQPKLMSHEEKDLLILSMLKRIEDQQKLIEILTDCINTLTKLPLM